MSRQIKRVKLGAEAVGRSFEMSLPGFAIIERVGISPTDGEASLWYTCDPDYNGEDTAHRFVVLLDDGVVEGNAVNHCGIWWEGDHTFHLYEIFKEKP